MKENNRIFTCLLVVQEVSQRLLSELIGADSATKEVKQTFSVYLKHGEKFRNRWSKAISNKYGEEALELHEIDSDNHYDLFNLVSQFTTEEQISRAKALLYNLLNESKL